MKAPAPPSVPVHVIASAATQVAVPNAIQAPAPESVLAPVGAPAFKDMPVKTPAAPVAPATQPSVTPI